MFLEHVNELAVFVAAVISVAVGSIWYSPLLFGTSWMRSAGLTLEDEDLSPLEAGFLTAKGIAIQFVFFFIVAQCIAVARSLKVVSLLELGAGLAVLLVSYLLGVVVWERRSLSYLLIHTGYGTLALAVGIGIIAYWPW